MTVSNPITKVIQIIKRADGSEARIVATELFGEGLHRSIDVYVHRRSGPDSPWELCSDQPHPDWRSMSVDEYIARGRSEKFRTVTHGEIFRAASMLGTELHA